MAETPNTYTNFAFTTLAGGAGGNGTTLGVTDSSALLVAGTGGRFPTVGPTSLLIGSFTGSSEIVNMTGSRSADTIVMLRGQEGTTAQSWPIGTQVQAVLTAGGLTNLWNAVKWRTTSVMDYGAVGDGVTDDGPAFRAACAGGGHVIVPGGHTYILLPIANPSDGTFSAGVFLPSNTWLDGDGNGIAELKLSPSAGNQSMVVQNLHPSNVGGNDQHIYISNLTINGNSVNQPGTTDRNRGIYVGYARDIRIFNVNVRNVYGAGGGGNGPNGTPNEGHHIVLAYSSDIIIENCAAWSDDGGNTASGIGVSDCWNSRFKNCTVFGMKYGWGLTTYDASNLDVESVSVYSCNQGFFFELGTNVNLANCVSGGIAPFAATAYPWTNSQFLGNSSFGFSSRGTVGLRMTNCISQANQYGLYINNEASVPGPARNHASAVISNCRFVNNSSVGVWCNTVGDVLFLGTYAEANGGSGFYMDGIVPTGQQITYVNCISRSNSGYGWECHNSGISPNVLIQDSYSLSNTTNDVFENGAGNQLRGHKVTPGMPLSTVAYTSQFATPVVTYVTGGSVTAILVNGTATGMTSGPIFLKPGQQIAITYTQSPSWQWFGV